MGAKALAPLDPYGASTLTQAPRRVDLAIAPARLSDLAS